MEDIIWEAPEFEHQERGFFWYYMIGFIAVVLILLALWQRNVLFALFVLIASTTVLLIGKNNPPRYRVTLAQGMITIGTSGSHHMNDFLGFVIHDGGQKDDSWGKILLRPKRRFRPYFPIMIPREKLEQIKRHLAEYLPELEHEPSLTDELVRFFKL